jgi:hypothetical protein
MKFGEKLDVMKSGEKLNVMKFGEKLNVMFQSNKTIEECTVELLELRLCPEDKIFF